jgi:hypothetical protein
LFFRIGFFDLKLLCELSRNVNLMNFSHVSSD